MPFADDRSMDSLPSDPDQPWPPVRHNPVAYSYRLWDAWWTGDPDKLMRAYYSLSGNSPTGRQFFTTTGEAGLTPARPGQFRGGLIGQLRRWYWGTPTPPGEKRTNYHVPIAADLSAASAALLFAQPPALTFDDNSDGNASAVQDYLNGLVDDGMHATLLEAADLCSALGGVYLRVVWDSDVAAEAWLDQVPVDAAIPEFRYNRLTAVTFWHVIADEGKTVVRHLEKHIPHQNVILHQVYEGDQKKIGRPVDLTAFEETRPIARLLTSGNAIEFPDQPRDASTVVYVPNMRPNRIWRDVGPWTAPLGRSDYQGLEPFMDGLDEAFSSWMRDIRLGKARLIVPHSYLDNIGRGKGAVFEPEREVFEPVNMLVTGESTAGTGIMPQQFNIRWQEHKGTVDALIEYVVSQAGYSGQSLGLEGDVAQTATEVDARERKSLTTRGRKINYWRPAYADILYGLMAVNATEFGSSIAPVRPDIEFPDVVLPNMLELAQTVAALRAAEAASVETAVATTHPDWDITEIKAEVARIYAEMNLNVLDKARVMLSEPMTSTTPLEQQLEQLPAALEVTDDPAAVGQVAAQTQADPE